MLACAAFLVNAEEPLRYQGSVNVNAGSGDFAPTYMTANNGGVLSQPKGMQLRLKASKDFDLNSRFSYSFGVDAVGGWQSEYSQYDQSSLPTPAQGKRPSAIMLQQLYGEVKYRSLFLSVGMKERQSPLLNDELGVGDYTQSNNARPVPQVRVGFIDFQDVPFTKGWLQIQGEIAYGYYLQDNWLEDHFSKTTGFINKGEYYHYKRCYFRTKPQKPFSVTVGMQVVTEFGGTAYYYNNGKETSVSRYNTTWKDFVRAFTTQGGGESEGDAVYHYGNTLGSWDFVGRYRLHDNTELKAFFQWPFEDGSGIGKQNGFDGIWGLEYKSPRKAIVNGAMIEYVDFTNQSGPMHWAPGDHAGTDFVDQATGADGYYGNFRCNSYSYFGFSQGTFFIPQTLYDRLGAERITDNRIRGFQVAATGTIYAPLDYRVLVSWRRSWGSYSRPRTATADVTSFMLEGTYHMPKIPGLTLKGQIAFDKGDLIGDNFGVLFGVSYSGSLNIFDKKR